MHRSFSHSDRILASDEIDTLNSAKSSLVIVPTELAPRSCDEREVSSVSGMLFEPSTCTCGNSRQ